MGIFFSFNGVASPFFQATHSLSLKPENLEAGIKEPLFPCKDDDEEYGCARSRVVRNVHRRMITA